MQYHTYQKSFGAPSQVIGVNMPTTIIIQIHIVNELFVKLNINSAINSMKTIAAPYKVSITHALLRYSKNIDQCNEPN